MADWIEDIPPKPPLSACHNGMNGDFPSVTHNCNSNYDTAKAGGLAFIRGYDNNVVVSIYREEIFYDYCRTIQESEKVMNAVLCMGTTKEKKEQEQ